MINRKNKIHLLPEKHITTGVGLHMLYNKVSHEFKLHDHGFHELVLVLGGGANHYVNGEVYPMKGNLLMFVRDRDVHTYSDHLGREFEYYTLVISYETMECLLSFLGNGFPSSALFTPFLPPKVALSQTEADSLSSSFSRLFMLMNTDPDEFMTETRLILASTLTKYFGKSFGSSSDAPLWLENAYKKMTLPKNFTKGTEQFFKLCGKSREHCIRELSKHYSTTPARYVSGLRMSYAANLLSSSNLTVSEIAYECGFGSISSFYSQFEREYGITPKSFRGTEELKLT